MKIISFSLLFFFLLLLIRYVTNERYFSLLELDFSGHTHTIYIYCLYYKNNMYPVDSGNYDLNDYGSNVNGQNIVVENGIENHSKKKFQ